MSVLKTFPQFTRDYVRKGISYVNLMYLLKAIAPYRTSESKDKADKGNTGINEPIKQEKITHFEQFNF